MSKTNRKTTWGEYGDVALCRALDMAKSGVPLRKIQRETGICRRTIRRYRDGLVKKPGQIVLGSYRQVLPQEFETELVSHIMDMQSRFFGLTETNVRKLAYQLAMKNDIITPFDHKKKMAGKKWLENFLQRHKNLSIRTPEARSMGRAVAFNRPQEDRFFSILARQLKKGFTASNIYNMDESPQAT